MEYSPCRTRIRILYATFKHTHFTLNPKDEKTLSAGFFGIHPGNYVHNLWVLFCKLDCDGVTKLICFIMLFIYTLYMCCLGVL